MNFSITTATGIGHHINNFSTSPTLEVGYLDQVSLAKVFRHIIARVVAPATNSMRAVNMKQLKNCSFNRKLLSDYTYKSCTNKDSYTLPRSAQDVQNNDCFRPAPWGSLDNFLPNAVGVDADGIDSAKQLFLETLASTVYIQGLGYDAKSNSTETSTCSGARVHQDFILTAGHCLTGNMPTKSFKVYFDYHFA